MARGIVNLLTMRLKSVRGLQPHNFDTNYLQKLLEAGSLELEDALYILSSANNVISGLREHLNKVTSCVDAVKEVSGSARNSQWMKGQK